MNKRTLPEFMENHTAGINIKIGDNNQTTHFKESKMSEEFMALLPLRFTLIDLSGIKKYARLPIELSEEGQQMRTCEVGDLAYWSAGPGLVIFYRQETAMVDSGLYLLGKIEINKEISKMTKLEIELIR